MCGPSNILKKKKNFFKLSRSTYLCTIKEIGRCTGSLIMALSLLCFPLAKRNLNRQQTCFSGLGEKGSINLIYIWLKPIVRACCCADIWFYRFGTFVYEVNKWFTCHQKVNTKTLRPTVSTSSSVVRPWRCFLQHCYSFICVIVEYVMRTTIWDEASLVEK